MIRQRIWNWISRESVLQAVSGNSKALNQKQHKGEHVSAGAMLSAETATMVNSIFLGYIQCPKVMQVLPKLKSTRKPIDQRRRPLDQHPRWR
jgi:hypothetical protein